MTTSLRKAMVLAAGVGRRLRPLTVRSAKPALALMGRPLIDYILRRLSRAGFEEAVVNLHHHPQTVTPSLDDAPSGLTITRSLEAELLGTAGGLSRAAEHFSSERAFLLMNADTLVDFDLDAIAHTHETSDALATLLLRPRPSGSAYSSVHVGDGGRIEGISTSAKAKSASTGIEGEWMFAGVWVLSPEIFKYLSGRAAGLEKELLPRLIEDRAVVACPQNTNWVTIDTPRRYLSACLSMAREGWFEEDWNVKALPDHPPVTAWAGTGTKVARGAVLRGGVVLGQRCRVGKRAHLETVLCWDDVIIPAGVKLVNCIVTHGVTLQSGMELTDRVVMAAGDDPSGLRKREIRDGLVIASFGNGRTRGL
jgi:NDP-sugar pyrophosphorylase family protein